jgi:hypothetical protein
VGTYVEEIKSRLILSAMIRQSSGSPQYSTTDVAGTTVDNFEVFASPYYEMADVLLISGINRIDGA